MVALAGQVRTPVSTRYVGIALVVVLGSVTLASCGSDECVATAVGQCTSSSNMSSPYGSAVQTPNGAHISLDCRPYNIPGYTNSDCLYSHYCGVADAVPCTMKLADRDGVVIKRATTVGFQSEAGDISPSATSPAYDSTKPIIDQESLGHAVGYLEVCNAPLPYDVDPFVNEPHAVADLGCGVRTTNPRDGLVTVIAWVRGEEGYVDLNGNGMYDEGEPFIDLGEPYVDLNDNGRWDPGEWFLDVNGNGVYDGPNGKWDSDTIIWTQTRVLYTGFPSNLLSTISYSGAPGTLTLHVGPPATMQPVSVQFADEHLNPMSGFTTYSATTATGHLAATLAISEADMDSLGMSFRLLYCPQPTISAECEDGPAGQACKTSPCYVVADVGSIGYAETVRTVEVSCAGTTTGLDNVDITATTASLTPADSPLPVENVTIHFSVVGQCVP